MCFPKLLDAESCYYMYAGTNGFSVRKSTCASDEEGFIRHTLLCSKQGSSNVNVPPPNANVVKLHTLVVDVKQKLHL